MKHVRILHERRPSVNVWWFPMQFCQSRLGRYQSSGYYSCTLITLLLADKLAKQCRGFFTHVDTLPLQIANVFAGAIDAGNAVYLSRPGDGSSKTITIPDAQQLLGEQPVLDFQLKEWFYTHLTVDCSTLASDAQYLQDAALRLMDVFHVGIELFQVSHRHQPDQSLYVALIADNRTVMFTFDFHADLVAFFDSHHHRQCGAAIAQCSMTQTLELIVWYLTMVNNVYGGQPSAFEISFLSMDTQKLPKPSSSNDQLAQSKV